MESQVAYAIQTETVLNTLIKHGHRYEDCIYRYSLGRFYRFYWHCLRKEIQDFIREVSMVPMADDKDKQKVIQQQETTLAELDEQIKKAFGYGSLNIDISGKDDEVTIADLQNFLNG